MTLSNDIPNWSFHVFDTAGEFHGRSMSGHSRAVWNWVGYKVHLTESCDEDQPHLISHVKTTAAPVADGDALETIHEGLAAEGLLPAVHLADTGYIDAKRLLSSRTRYDFDLLGPPRGDYHRRGRENKGFAMRNFTIDWEQHHAVCPAGQTSANWVPTLDPKGTPVIRVNFASSTCKACPHCFDCVDADGVRCTLTLRVPELQIALQTARQRENTTEFRQQYSAEGPISHAA